MGNKTNTAPGVAAMKKAKARKTRSDKGKWTPLQETFVQFYLRYGDGGRAYREAARDHEIECPFDGARKKAYVMLHHPHVAKFIAEVRKETAARLGITTDRIKEGLAKIAFARPIFRVDKNGDPIVDLRNADEADLASIAETTVETYIEGRGDNAQTVKRVRIKQHPKTQALELLGRAEKMFSDKIEHSGEVHFTEIVRRVVDPKH